MCGPCSLHKYRLVIQLPKVKEKAKVKMQVLSYRFHILIGIQSNYSISALSTSHIKNGRTSTNQCFRTIQPDCNNCQIYCLDR